MTALNIDSEGIDETNPALHTDFQYPNDEVDVDLEVKKACQEFVTRFIALTFTSDNIRLTMAAYCVATGIDLTFLLGTNQENKVASLLGVSRQTLDTMVKRICAEHGITKPIQKHEKAKPNKYSKVSQSQLA